MTVKEYITKKLNEKGLLQGEVKMFILDLSMSTSVHKMLDVDIDDVPRPWLTALDDTIESKLKQMK